MGTRATTSDACADGVCAGVSGSGDGLLDPACEECDGADSDACPGTFQPDCRCAVADQRGQ